MPSFIRNGRFLDPSDQWVYGDLIVEDGVIVRVTDGPDIEALIADDAAVILDADGNRVGPGFIDLQINGGFGIDLQSDPGAVWELGARLPSIGVTAFLPTLTTNGYARVEQALAAIEQRPPDYRGAEPLGWHLEGPWLSQTKRGAHASSKLEAIPDELPDWYAPEYGVAMVTLDPECAGAMGVTQELSDRGVVVSYGHTDASYATAFEAYRWGATMGTHLFNAMVGLHHREPGLAAALLSDRCPARFGLIVDGEHVAPALVDIAWRLASDRLVLVSDAVAPLGVTAEPVFRLDDGTLAGAVIGLDQSVLNLAAFTGCSAAQAHRSASARPADVLVDSSRGELWPGLRADAVVLDDDGSVVATMIAGELVYEIGGSG